MSESKNRRLRRKRSRLNYLASLAKKDSSAFSREWRKILEGWSYEVRRRAQSLVDEQGAPTALAFSAIEEVAAVLHDCGTDVYEREWPATFHVLTHACCVAISHATGHALSPLTFAQRFQDRIKTR